VIFLELVLQNFGSYCGRQVINLRPEIDNNPRPIILIGGMNGGGKTTLMDAIRLSLYGHRAQCSNRGNLSYSDFLNQSVNKYAKPEEETGIELLFEHILNNVPVEFRIKRTWKKNPRNGKDTLGVLVDDWPDAALAKTWDERIEDLLPLGISNLFLFDGEQVKELAEMETTPSLVVEAIESLLGLELAERLAVDLDILVNRKRKAIAETKDLATLEEIEQKLNFQKQEYDSAKQALASIQNQLDKAHEEHSSASEKFLSEGGKIAGERSQLEKQLHDLGADTEEVRNKLREVAGEILPLALISPLLNSAKIQADKEHHASQAKIAHDVLQERSQRLLNYISELGLAAKQINKIKDFIELEERELQQEISSNEAAWLNADRETSNLLANISDRNLPNQIQIAEEKLKTLKNIEAEITSTERQLAVAASPEAYEKLTNAVREAQAELVAAQTAYDAKKKLSEDLWDAIEKTKKRLGEYSQENIDRKNDEHIINAAAKVQSTLKVFREKLTLRKLNQLESVVTECFLYLLHKSDLVHRVAIDSKTFSLSLYDLQGQLVPKHRLSAGEKQLLAIAFLWGLARVSGRKLPIAIDTPLGRLDSSHRSNLVERYFPAASHQVILLSTDTEIGELEVKKLREQEAIAREYLLKYDSSARQTVVEGGYFWEA
jgi:DNA sulfur modification protein DndD